MDAGKRSYFKNAAAKVIVIALGVLLIQDLQTAQGGTFTLLRDQIGKFERNNSSAAFDEFLSNETSPTYIVGSKDLKQVRPWIGASSSVADSQGKPRSQYIRIPKYSDWNKKVLQIFISPHFLTGDTKFKAKIKSGSGSIILGAEHLFRTIGSNVRSEAWEIRAQVKDTTQNLDIEISGNQTAGNNYLYFDAIEIRQFSPSTITENGDPIYRTFPGINLESGEVLSNVFIQKNGKISSQDESGKVRWEVQAPANTSLSGGMDFNQDGLVDGTLVYWKSTGVSCNTNYIGNSKISLLNGANGGVSSLTNMVQDICWPQVKPDSGINYATIQWANHSVIFGGGSKIMTSMQYETQAWFYDLLQGVYALGYLFFPSTNYYDTYYQYDRPNPWNNGYSFTKDPHVANGMIVNVRGEDRAVFFTAARVVQYGVESYWSGQLRADYPFLSGGRQDLVGRNYGLIQQDPLFPQLMHLVSGDISSSVYADLLSGGAPSNLWGGLERHVTVYDMVNNGLNDTFFSYGKDQAAGNPWLNRVTAAGHSIFKVNDTTTRTAFSVYNASGSALGWKVLVATAGNSAAQIVIPNLILWDLVDVDGDGLEEMICSPTSASGGYTPYNETVIYKWSETTKQVTLYKRISGVIPKMIARFNEPARRSSNSALYDVGIFERNGKIWMRMINPYTKLETSAQI